MVLKGWGSVRRNFPEESDCIWSGILRNYDISIWGRWFRAGIRCPNILFIKYRDLDSLWNSFVALTFVSVSRLSIFLAVCRHGESEIDTNCQSKKQRSANPQLASGTRHLPCVCRFVFILAPAICNLQSAIRTATATVFWGKCEKFFCRKKLKTKKKKVSEECLSSGWHH